MDIRERFDHSVLQTRHFWEVSRIGFVKKLIRKYVGKAAVVIDAGCGDCAVSSVLAEEFSDCSYIGVDTALSDRDISELQTALPQNLTVRNDWEQVKTEAGLILLLDVLEHIPEPHPFLISLKDKIAPDGCMIVTVPAFQCLFSEHDKFLHHYRRYSYSELKEELRNAGFEIVAGGYFFAVLLFPRLIQKILRSPAAGENSLKPLPKRLNCLFAAVLTADADITFSLCRKGIMIPGLSCAAVVRKSQHI